MSSDRNCREVHAPAVWFIIALAALLMISTGMCMQKSSTIASNDHELGMLRPKIERLQAEAADNIGRLAVPADGTYTVMSCAQYACLMASGERDRNDPRLLVVRGYKMTYNNLAHRSIPAGQMVKVENGEIQAVFKEDR